MEAFKALNFSFISFYGFAVLFLFGVFFLSDVLVVRLLSIWFTFSFCVFVSKKKIKVSLVFILIFLALLLRFLLTSFNFVRLVLFFVPFTWLFSFYVFREFIKDFGVNKFLNVVFLIAFVVSFPALIALAPGTRSSGLLLNANVLAFFLLPLIPVSFYYADQPKKLFLPVLLVLALFATASRGCILVAFISTLLFFHLVRRNFLFPFLAFLFSSPLFFITRSINSLNAFSTNGRNIIWSKGISMFISSPVFGTSSPLVGLQNVYITVLAYFGIVGFAVLCYILYSILMRIKISKDSQLKFVLLAAFVAFLLEGFFESLFNAIIFLQVSAVTALIYTLPIKTKISKMRRKK